MHCFNYLPWSQIRKVRWTYNLDDLRGNKWSCNKKNQANDIITSCSDKRLLLWIPMIKRLILIKHHLKTSLKRLWIPFRRTRNKEIEWPTYCTAYSNWGSWNIQSWWTSKTVTNISRVKQNRKRLTCIKKKVLMKLPLRTL